MATATRFQNPLAGAGAWVTQDHAQWNGSFKKYHLGEDWSAGAGDTDIGVPVASAANGVVVYAKWAGATWGNVVMIQHTLANGKIVTSLYGHLDAISVRNGATVAIGQNIGTIGDANGLYDAHLHFEIYLGRLTQPGPGYTIAPDPNPTSDGWVDPSEFIENFISPVVSQADLKIAKAWLSDATLSRGQDLRVNLHVENAGGVDVRGKTSFYWSADDRFDFRTDKLVATDSHGTLSRGERDTNEYEVIDHAVLARLGDGYIFAVIDAERVVAETNETNNTHYGLEFWI